MSDVSEKTTIQKTSIAPMLSVRRGAQAVEFYKAAFGAKELFRWWRDWDLEGRSFGWRMSRRNIAISVRNRWAEGPCGW